MKPYNGYKAERRVNRVPLPAGGYVAKILKAEEVEYSWGSVLQLSFDIAEGEHKDFFAKDYKANTAEDKKWRGTYRLTVPADDGTDKDEWTKRSFNDAMACIEESNNGYQWNWDEKSLAGKFIGILFRDREWEMNGRTGWTTEAGKITTAADIREGTFKPLNAKPLNNSSASGAFASPATWEPASDSDLPF